MKYLIAAFTVLAALTASGCQSGPSSDYPAAQQIVMDLAEAHDDVVRLSLHARPEGEQDTMCIASTSSAKTGKPSDPEDVQALHSGEVVEMMEGENFDYTAPVKDNNGVTFAVVGVTVSGDDTGMMKASAEAIAAEIQRAVATAPNPLW